MVAEGAEEIARGLGRGRGLRALAAGLVAAVVVLAAALAYVSWPRGSSPLPGPTLPAPPANVAAAGEDARVRIAWDSVAGAARYNLYRASVPGVTAENYAGLPDGARHGNVASPYTVAPLTNGKTYYFRVTAFNDAGESEVSAEVSATPSAGPAGTPVYVTGTAVLDSGAAPSGAVVTARAEDGSATGTGTTAADGRFNVRLEPRLGTRVLVQVRYAPAGAPSATGFRWSVAVTEEGAWYVGRIVLPDPSAHRLTMASGVAYDPDGSVLVKDLPANVASVWAQEYDPDASTDAFPGDFAEGTILPLDSFGFLWISALDASGAPVVNLASPATVRLAVPPGQWVDVEDLQPGNGAIDIPVYSFDYGTGYWVREANGRVTDSAGTPVPESAETSIRLGTYAGEVYAEFHPDHFSWWNLDKTPSNCTTDFGDAPDPPYPSLLASNGARHLNICRAWLGAWVDAEPDAKVPNADLYDDGVRTHNPLTVRVSNWDWNGTLYLNALIDGNNDGDWSDVGEWTIQNLPMNVPMRKGEIVVTDYVWDGRTWMRLTLTGSPISNYVGTGEFAIGETEDYPFMNDQLSVWVPGNGTVTSDPSGIDCHRGSGSCVASYRAGTSVELTVAPDPGQSFIGWGGDCSRAGTNVTCVLAMERERHVVASFTAPYHYLAVTIPAGAGTVTSDPPGVDCHSGWNGTNLGDCIVAFPTGTNVTLTATPDTAYAFSYWTGDCTGTSPVCTLTMDSDKWIFAWFARRP